jgi:hypothetical protein
MLGYLKEDMFKTLTHIKYYNIIAGLLDTLTGIVLIAKPNIILSIMGASEIDMPNIFLKYVGVFVMATGLTYFISFFNSFFNITYIQLSLVLWTTSSLVRLCVASFVFSQVYLSALSLSWLLVAFSDLSLAVFQFYLLSIWKLRINE